MTRSSSDQLRAAAATYYAERLRRHGGGPAAMDWRDAASQRLRFEVLTRHLSLAPGDYSIADVGCGDGELLEYLRQAGRSPSSYLGLDVSPEMVTACERRFGPGTARIGSTSELRPKAFDYVVASGTFNVRQDAGIETWRQYFDASVAEMFAACRVATAWNVMSSRVDWRLPHLFYLDAEDVPALASRCGTRRFLLDHSYPLYEMTAVLWR